MRKKDSFFLSCLNIQSKLKMTITQYLIERLISTLLLGGDLNIDLMKVNTERKERLLKTSFNRQRIH